MFLMREAAVNPVSHAWFLLQGSLGVVVMYGGDPIPRSPFSVGVAAPLDLSRVTVNNLESREYLQRFTWS